MKYNVKIPNSEGRFGYGENTINVTNWFPIACVHDDRGWNLKGYEAVGDPFIVIPVIFMLRFNT